jgi:hypothetical protein
VVLEKTSLLAGHTRTWKCILHKQLGYLTMSNDYKPAETQKIGFIWRFIRFIWREFTWAEWAIIVALLCIVVSFLYGWHVKAVAAKAEAVAANAKAIAAKAEAVAANAKAVAAKAEADARAKLAKYDAMLKECQRVLGKPVTDPKEIKETLDKLALDSDQAKKLAREWNAYSENVMEIFKKELEGYWDTSAAKRAIEGVNKLERPQPIPK